MKHTPLNLSRLAAMDGGRATRLLQEIREASLAGDRPPMPPRPVIEASWQRMRRLGVSPHQETGPVVMTPEELEHRRRTSALGEVIRGVCDGLGGFVDASLQILVVSDEQGRVLWREGNAKVMRRADGISLEEGVSWAEGATGTNAIGTALTAGAPVQVHSAEHFVHTLTRWTCAAAPVHDPRDGRLLGVVDVSGPATSFHPATLALVTAVARLAESELRERHLRAVERLRSVAAPILCRVGGRAAAVDTHGWTAAVTGMAPVDRLPLPKSVRPGRLWLPTLGMCTVEPLPGGWLLTVEEEPPPDAPSKVVLDLSRPRRWSVTVSGAAGSWAQELTPRHAELLYVLAVRRDGRSAAELAADVFGDPTRTATVRAEMSRVRRHLAGVLAHRPYRFKEEVEVSVLRPDHPTDLLPHSTAPAVTDGRSANEPPRPVWPEEGRVVP
ncbi:Acetoin dehydrogenase operon transcriptional activator AcoR [Streptomyces sp. S4.7]|uniref:helix-turn-helix domain-containing protein n=1 Tax=Streptomyces sp. S4.7 TaxID=2705439 RepID=UPI001398A4C0|nr:helix-turn-helix domain-containing protein [Streptomyces sp. S4.7]QHY99046.1 Acetoin dehydrogenase operon transcriptional activator AcoR [Streptomyces sp. S4.7]